MSSGTVFWFMWRDVSCGYNWEPVGLAHKSKLIKTIKSWNLTIKVRFQLLYVRMC